MSAKLRRGIALALVACSWGLPVAAAVLDVTKTTDSDDGVCDGDCSLRRLSARPQGGATDIGSFELEPR